MADDVEIKFLGNLEGIRVSITQMSELLRGLVNPIQGVKKELGEIAEAFAAAFAIDKINEFARGMGELGEQIERSAAIMGTSTDAVQQLGYIARSSGIGIDELQRAFGLLSRSVIEQSDRTKRALAALGLGFSSLGGKDANAQLEMFAEKFREIEDGATKDAIAMALFGRAGQQMIPYLNQGAEGIRRLNEESKALGAIIPPEAIAQLAELHHQFVMMDAAVKGATISAFMPFRSAVSGVVALVTDLASEFTAAMREGGALSSVMSGLAFLGKSLVTAFAAIAITLQNVWSAGVAAFNAIEKGSLNLQEVVNAVIRALAAQWEAFFEALRVTATASIRAIGVEFDNLATMGSAAVNRDWDGIKAAYAKIGDGAKAATAEIGNAWKKVGQGVDMGPARAAMDKFIADEKANWANYGNTVAARNAAFAKIYNTIWDEAHRHEEESKKRAANFAPPTDKDRVSAAIKAIDGEIKAEQAGLAQKIAIYDLAASAHMISESERVASVRSATEQEFAAELALEKSKLQIRGLTATQTQEINNKITALENKHRLDEISLDKQAVADRQKTWEGYFSTIQGAFNSQLRGLLAGTTSFKQAFKSIMGDLIIAFIQAVEKMVFEWIAGQIGMTAATTVGAQARAAAETTGMLGSMAATVSMALSKIAAGAAATVAGVTANQAPIVGPAAVGEGIAAGAAVEAAAQGLLLAPMAVAETGWWNVPANSLTMLHAGEMVVPAPFANDFRTNGGGLSSLGPVHFNISAIDARGVKQFFKEHGDLIARQLRTTYDSSRSLRPGF